MKLEIIFGLSPLTHQLIKEIIMATIEAQVQQILTNQASIQASLATLQTAITAIGTPPAATVDFTPVLTAVAGVAAQITDVQTQIETPPAS